MTRYCFKNLIITFIRLSHGIKFGTPSLGDPPETTEVKTVIDAIDIPVLVGSGVTLENVHKYVHANALIVGSYFKTDGYWFNDLEQVRIEKFMRHIRSMRENEAQA